MIPCPDRYIIETAIIEYCNSHGEHAHFATMIQFILLLGNVYLFYVVTYVTIYFNRVGVKAAKAAGMKVVAVPSLQNAANQYSIADSVLHSLLEFRPELWGLPPFEDCLYPSNLFTFLILISHPLI